jgi:hypothetical protein
MLLCDLSGYPERGPPLGGTPGIDADRRRASIHRHSRCARAQPRTGCGLFASDCDTRAGRVPTGVAALASHEPRTAALPTLTTTGQHLPAVRAGAVLDRLAEISPSITWFGAQPSRDARLVEASFLRSVRTLLRRISLSYETSGRVPGEPAHLHVTAIEPGST